MEHCYALWTCNAALFLAVVNVISHGLKKLVTLPHAYLQKFSYLGRVPLSIGIKKRAVGFWYDMILSKDKLSSIIFQISLHDAVHNNHRFNWLHFVQSIFDKC